MLGDGSLWKPMNTWKSFY